MNGKKKKKEERVKESSREGKKEKKIERVGKKDKYSSYQHIRLNQ